MQFASHAIQNEPALLAGVGEGDGNAYDVSQINMLSQHFAPRTWYHVENMKMRKIYLQD